MKRPNPPCYKCPDRSAECHAVCEKWAEYEQARAKYYKWKNEAAAAEHDIRAIYADRIEAQRKRRRRNKVN